MQRAPFRDSFECGDFILSLGSLFFYSLPLLPMYCTKTDDRTRTTGEILCEHVKSLDYNARGIAFVEKLPDDLLSEVLDRIQMSIEAI